RISAPERVLMRKRSKTLGRRGRKPRRNSDVSALAPAAVHPTDAIAGTVKAPIRGRVSRKTAARLPVTVRRVSAAVAARAPENPLRGTNRLPRLHRLCQAHQLCQGM